MVVASYAVAEDRITSMVPSAVPDGRASVVTDAEGPYTVVASKAVAEGRYTSTSAMSVVADVANVVVEAELL